MIAGTRPARREVMPQTPGILAPPPLATVSREPAAGILVGRHSDND